MIRFYFSLLGFPKKEAAKSQRGIVLMRLKKNFNIGEDRAR